MMNFKLFLHDNLYSLYKFKLHLDTLLFVNMSEKDKECLPALQRLANGKLRLNPTTEAKAVQIGRRNDM